MEKKSAKDNGKFRKNIYDASIKYSSGSRNASLVVTFGHEGMHGRGTSALQEFYEKHKEELLKCCLDDTKGLNDQNPEVAMTFLPSAVGDGEIIKNVFRSAIPPKLPNKLEALNDAQCIEWLCPEIRTNIGERTNECIFRIKWGNMAHMPTFWPENLVPWHLVHSPTNGGNTNHGIAFGLVMKEAIKNRLAEKGLDWKTHVTLSRDMDQEERKVKYRSKQVKQAGAIAIVHPVETMEMPQEHLEIDPLEEIPVSDQREYSPARDIQRGEKEKEDDIQRGEKEKEAETEEEHQEPLPAILTPPSEEDHMELDSENFEEENMFDSFGRIILPLRPSNSGASRSPVSPANSGASTSPVSTPPGSVAPAPSPSSEPTPPVTNHSRRLYGSTSSNVSRGKGGVCRIIESANKFIPGGEEPDNGPNITLEWKKWKNEETLRITKALKKIRSSTQEVQCARCLKIIKCKTFLNHTTKPPGCKEMLPHFKLKNFTAFYKKESSFPANSNYKF